MTDSAAQFRGRLERADRHIIAGWAFDPAHPGTPVALTLLIDGIPAGTIHADQFRGDLRDSGLGTGHHAFEIHMPQRLTTLTPRVVALVRASDGQPLEFSPVTVPDEPLNADDALSAVANAITLARAGDGDILGRRLYALAARIAELEAPPDPPQTVFLTRWGVPVKPHPSARPMALVIDENLPDPGRDAGSNAIISHMRALTTLGFAVTFVPDRLLNTTPDAVARLAVHNIQVWHAPWIGSVEEVLRESAPMLVYVHRYGVMARYAALIRRWCPQARLVYCLADLHALRAARAEALQSGDAAEPPSVTALRIAEYNAILTADAVITHSSHEAALLNNALPDAPIHLIPWDVSPNPTPIPFTDRAGVTFLGSYGHKPNLDAAYMLLNSIMPLVWATNPTIPCLLAGTDLPDSLREQAANSSGPIKLLGHVKHIDTLWSQTRLSIAPLRFGAGLKGKVLDSLAAGIPCICSPIAAEGMDLPNDLARYIGDTPAALANAIITLHEDETANAEARAAGLTFITDTFNPARIQAGLAAAAGLPSKAET